MAVIQVNSYEDFKLILDGAHTTVYYCQKNPYWYVYAPVDNDWFWLSLTSDDFKNLDAEPKTFKADFPNNIKLNDGLDFK